VRRLNSGASAPLFLLARLAYYVSMLHSATARLRTATISDLEHVIQLSESPESHVRWNRSHYLDALNPSASRKLLVAEADGEWKGIVGFIMVRTVGDEWEIENVVISAAVRRKGLGFLMLMTVLEMARREQAARVLLEVRASNVAAIALYEKCGFQQDGQRKNYYSHPTEDALLFSLSLRKSS
jgi:ribosomal-protein-alanine N-acetyltransferase